MNPKTKLVILLVFIALMTVVDTFLLIKYLELRRINKLAEPIAEKYTAAVNEFVKIRQEIDENPILLNNDLDDKMDLVRDYLMTAGDFLKKAIETGNENYFELANSFINKANENLKTIKAEIEKYKSASTP